MVHPKDWLPARKKSWSASGVRVFSEFDFSPHIFHIVTLETDDYTAVRAYRLYEHIPGPRGAHHKGSLEFLTLLTWALERPTSFSRNYISSQDWHHPAGEFHRAHEAEVYIDIAQAIGKERLERITKAIETDYKRLYGHTPGPFRN